MFHPQKVPYGVRWEIINFLFKWRLLTTRALIERFYPMVEPITGYGKLLDLKKLGYIKQYCNKDGTHWAWGLTKKGFSLYDLNELREVGYGFHSFEHDLLATAFHLGDWLNYKDGPDPLDDTPLSSEQELRRFYKEHLPPWVPKGDGHRADGYWKIDLRDIVSSVALEVELNIKCQTDYSGTHVYYQFARERNELHRVIWLVRTLRGAKSILKKMEQSQSGDKSFHLFVLLPDFLKFGWAAPIVLGKETGQTVSQVLSPTQSEMVIPSKTPCTMSLLDTRKSANVHGISEQQKKNIFAR